MEPRTFLLASFAIVLISMGSIEAYYDAIEEYLNENVKESDVIANMDAAAELLEQLLKPSKFSIEDVKKFVALREVLDEPKCNREQYDIIRQNAAAIGLHSSNNGNSVVRRVDKVMDKVLAEHARICSKIYPEIYGTRKRELDSDVFERAETVANSIIKADQAVEKPKHDSAWDLYTSENLFKFYISDHLSINKLNRKNLKRALVSNAGDASDVKFALNSKTVKKDLIRELAKIYVINPCKEFVGHFGPDLFEPAQLEIRFHIIEEHQEDLYKGWTYYTICKALIESESVALDDIVENWRRSS